MSKGYAVHTLMRQPQESVIDEQLLRECIYLAPSPYCEDDRLRIVGNSAAAVLQEKTRREVATMPLHTVTCLLLSYRHLTRIDNLYGLRSLTKLCLDNNHIRRIENLAHLTTLRWLDLSFNDIAVIEGLDSLVDLDNLSLFANRLDAITGLDALTRLTTLSLGNNAGIDNLDDAARALHRLKSLKVLTLRGCRVEAAAQYRARLLAFVPTLTFLDGKAVRAADVAAAREEQRENLLPLDEEDEQLLAAERAAAEEAAQQSSFARYNCPNETRLYDDLLQLQPEGGRDMAALLRSDAVAAATKDTVERFQLEFSERAKELADAMREVCARRERDEAAYHAALAQYTTRNTHASRARMHDFRRRLKEAQLPLGVAAAYNSNSGSNKAAGDAATSDAAVTAALRRELQALQPELLELEAEQYNALAALHNHTLTRWRADGVDVLLQSSFEVLYKLESDFQTALRQVFDALHEQRQKRERERGGGGVTAAATAAVASSSLASGDVSSGDVARAGAAGASVTDNAYGVRADGAGGSVAAVLDNKEEYQKLLSDWAELRRKHLETLELRHLKAEERTLAERAQRIHEQEQLRHRNRLVEITEYVQQMASLIP